MNKSHNIPLSLFELPSLRLKVHISRDPFAHELSLVETDVYDVYHCKNKT